MRTRALWASYVDTFPMVTEWAEWSEAEAAAKWDAALTTLPDYNVYQAYSWGEFKKRSGWIVRRGSVLVHSEPVAMAQCLVRELRSARVVVVWVPGGPVGSEVGRFRLGETLQERYRGWYLYLRANILEEAQSANRADMASAGWTPVQTRLGSNLTFHLDLAPDEKTRRRSLTSNWRHNLKRGEQRGGIIQVWDENQPLEPVYAVYHETNRLKGIPERFSIDDLQALRRTQGRAFTLAVVIGKDQRPCAIRGFARIGNKAYDLIAGVSSVGREQYSNYSLTWKLLELAREQGVHLYDLSGADPDAAASVFNFKKGLGGRLVSLVGEWEWARSWWLRWGVNFGIRFRSAQI